MQFVKLATSFYLDPAVITLSETAEVAFVRSLAYAGGAESSGFIPEAAMPMLMRSWTPARGRKLAAELVTAQLWVEVPGGWLLRTWQKHQEKLESGLAERRRGDAERQRRHRAKKTVTEDEESRDTSRDSGRDVSRENSREPSRASALARPRDVEVDLEEEPNPLLTDLSRRLSRNTRETTTTLELGRWQKLAGGADLLAEAEAFLVHNMAVILGDPVSAWEGWLKRAAEMAAADHRAPACERCHSTGWDGEDAEGRPRRCACRTVTPITSAPSAGVA